jgi:hypothetical protein
MIEMFSLSRLCSCARRSSDESNQPRRGPALSRSSWADEAHGLAGDVGRPALAFGLVAFLFGADSGAFRVHYCLASGV